MVPEHRKQKQKKKAAEEAAFAPTPAPVAAAPVQEADNSELIAVIAAAIAASEGTSTDGFVVRSIRKINRKKR
ncbi:OadG family transporter subunit [Blautia obeum]|uniref:OadG family transporter subunit n=1 Tax=Blautia obeum TaxID=40520 RepID=UPI0009E419C7